MALRDQPYLPLYVQDFLTDEKLMECSASATGIYIRLLCIMHKSDEYGVILLKQKDKQTDNQIKNFAIKLAKYLPYSTDEIVSGITELLSEGVLQNGGNKLSQKRMIRDNEISLIRAKSGKKGGLFAQAKIKANLQANTEDGNEDVNNNINVPFETFWNLYDKKVGSKKNCEKKWNKLTNEVRQKIIDTIPKFKASIKDMQFQPFPETYLNQERWNDEIVAIEVKKIKPQFQYGPES